MKQICVVYNANSGTGSSRQDIDQVFDDLDVKLNLIPIGDDLDIRLKRAINDGAEILVAAGGDGTVNAVAQVAATAERTLGVLPVGTLNHFAKDLGLPLDLREAATVIAKGCTQMIDYATVNDRLFVNNSSIGLYHALVRGRERRADKVGKWPAAGSALVGALRNLVSPRLHFSVDARLPVSLDGEVVTMNSPLNYATHPAGLKVCLPA